MNAVELLKSIRSDILDGLIANNCECENCQVHRLWLLQINEVLNERTPKNQETSVATHCEPVRVPGVAQKKQIEPENRSAVDGKTS